MEVVSSRRNYLRLRRGYNRVPSAKRSVRTVRLGGESKRSWKVRVAPKLRLIRLVSPVKVLRGLKNAYMNMMIKLASRTNTFKYGNVFGDRRIPGARRDRVSYSRSEFESRLILEIYKSMIPSLELGRE